MKKIFEKSWSAQFSFVLTTFSVKADWPRMLPESGAPWRTDGRPFSRQGKEAPAFAMACLPAIVILPAVQEE